MSASEKRYTDNWLKFVGWTLGRALLRGAVGGAGLSGSLLPPAAAVGAVDEGFPALTWWRTGARAGVAAAEAFATNTTPLRRRPEPAPGEANPG